MRVAGECGAVPQAGGLDHMTGTLTRTDQILPPVFRRKDEIKAVGSAAMQNTSACGVSSACLLVNNDGKGVVFL